MDVIAKEPASNLVDLSCCGTLTDWFFRYFGDMPCRSVIEMRARFEVGQNTPQEHTKGRGDTKRHCQCQTLVVLAISNLHWARLNACGQALLPFLLYIHQNVFTCEVSCRRAASPTKVVSVDPAITCVLTFHVSLVWCHGPLHSFLWQQAPEHRNTRLPIRLQIRWHAATSKRENLTWFWELRLRHLKLSTSCPISTKGLLDSWQQSTATSLEWWQDGLDSKRQGWGFSSFCKEAQCRKPPSNADYSHFCLSTWEEEEVSF